MWLEFCFNSSSPELFAQVKSKFCNSIISLVSSENEYGQCTLSFGNTTEAIANCLAGGFEKKVGDYSVLSIVQGGNRCVSTVSLEDFSC